MNAELSRSFALPPETYRLKLNQTEECGNNITARIRTLKPLAFFAKEFIRSLPLISLGPGSECLFSENLNKKYFLYKMLHLRASLSPLTLNRP